jgi:cation:H+ antiporter
MPILIFIGLLAIGFVLLIKGADYLVDGSASLAARLSVPDLVIGLTVVSFGTSSPELVVNVFANIQGNADLSFGNIIGSNITNTLLILGIAGIIYPLKTEKNTVWREIPFSFLSVIVLLVLVNDLIFDSGANVLSRNDGVILLLFFLVFIVYTFGITKIELDDEHDVDKLSNIKTIIYILIGLVGLGIGGKLVVDNAVKMAEFFGLSQKIIGLTIVAIGTSLPELVTSAMAAYKRKSDIAIGNVIGSNIFNIFLVLGISALIAPLPFAMTLNVDIMVLIAASTFLFISMFTGGVRVLDRWEAILLLIMYVGYMVFLLIRR